MREGVAGGGGGAGGGAGAGRQGQGDRQGLHEGGRRETEVRTCSEIYLLRHNVVGLG